MKRSSPRLTSLKTTLSRLSATAAALIVAGSTWATVLDDFNGAKTGWTDTLNGGTVVQSGGQFIVHAANPQGALAYSRKTSTAHANALGASLEYRVDVMSATPPNGDTNALAILGWVPTGGALLANGYSVSVGSADLKIQRNGSSLYETNFTVGGVSLQNTNITIMLRLTPSGSSVTVLVRVYRKIASGLIGQYGTAIFEQTVVDGAGVGIGQNGNAALGTLNQLSGAGTTIAFDNLQVFTTTTTVLDNFDVNNGLAGWTTFKKDAPDTIVESGGVVEVKAIITSSAGGFAGLYYTAKTFKIVDGGRVEFQFDLVANAAAGGGNASYPVLGYLPGGGLPALFSLTEYHVAADNIGHTIVVSGKQYGSWWAGRNDIQPPNSNARYIMTMTGEGSNCRVETRIEDLSLDINDPARISFQSEFVDTPNQDPGMNETASTKFPYMNVDGNFAISVFSAGAQPADAIYDNAIVTQTLPPPSAPTIGNISPVFGANFLTAGSTSVSFNANDTLNVPLGNMVLTLNGVRYTNGSPGVTITPTNAVSTSRHFDLSGTLAANANYAGDITVTGPSALSSSLAVAFDTFLTNDLVVEAEEYNFSTNGADGGAFINNPLLIAQGSSDPGAYNGLQGLQDIDFHDNRTSGVGNYDANHDFRLDNPYNTRSTDYLRSKYSNAGAQGDNGFNEEEVSDVRDGDWLNYTHTYPAGTYNIFLRQSQFKFPQSLSTLERVTSDPTQPAQTTAVLGSFIGSPVGTLFANTPLTDASSTPMVLRFSGAVSTLRLNDRQTPNGDADVGTMALNYLIFVPVASPGTLRPVVALSSPLNGAVISPNPNLGNSSSSPATSATIANRDTTVNTGTIVLKMNGSTVAATVTPTATGADVSWSLGVVPATRVITNTLVFQDSDGTNLTYSWSYSYPFLSAANSQPIGSFPLRGWNVRMVQTNAAPTLGNSLGRAEQQLAIPPTLPYEVTTQAVMQVLNFNDAGDGSTATAFGFFPNADPVLGLAPDGSHDSIATEILGYAKLTAGGHRFGALSDDGFLVRSGAALRDPAGTIMGTRDGGTFNGNFDFVAEATALYPVRIVWYENGGSAYFQIFSVDPTNPANRILLNDPTNPSGNVEVYQPLGVLAAPAVTGPWGAPAGLSIDPNSHTVTIPVSGAAQFYKMIGLTPVTLTNIHIVGSNVVFNY